MEKKSKNSQFTTLLANDVLARVERLRLSPNRRLTNRSRGEHLAGKGGGSNEFTDYRNYVDGDDVRFVDWNIFSRLNRPYLKQYRHEEEMHVVVIVDGTTSMMFDGKFDRARQLAACFGIMGLLNMERVSLYVSRMSGYAPDFFPPCTGRASMKRLLTHLENSEGGGDQPFDEAIEMTLRNHRGRGVVVLLSDFQSFGDFQRPLNLLHSSGLETFAIQIFGPSELNPEVDGDVRFVDSETGSTLDISSAGNLLKLYHEYRVGQQDELSFLCRQRNGKFLSIGSDDRLEHILFDLFRRKGWVR